jgi:hypothetical protein
MKNFALFHIQDHAAILIPHSSCLFGDLVQEISSFPTGTCEQNIMLGSLVRASEANVRNPLAIKTPE